MSVRDPARDSLPKSHVFVTIAHGRTTRTFVTRSGLAYLVMIGLPIALLWMAAATTYIVFHDDLVASLMLRQRDMQYGYEDRIASLRSQIDRDSTNRLVAQRSVETKLNEMAVRQAELLQRSKIVARLGEEVDRLSGSPTTLSRSENARACAKPDLSFGADPTPAADPARVGSAIPPLGDAKSSKPRPEAMLSIPDVSAEAMTPGVEPSDRVVSMANGLDLVAAKQENAVVAMGGRVQQRMSRFREALAAAGIAESRLAAHADRGAGGPFVPVTREDDGSPFAREAVGLQLTLSQAEQLAAAVRHVPFDRPLDGDPEITSPFGERTDPFLGRPAMHTGIDLSEETGTDVKATAPGRITVAGSLAGYGTMVEIDHGAGLATRYAHLSETLVSVGQSVVRGQVIGRVGSTGRATGPHLHYETRIDGEAVDPIRFLAAGHRLQSASTFP